MNFRLLIFLILFSTPASSQVIYKGHIINQKTKENVPYATIGLIKENTGCNANEAGFFQLNSVKPKEGDTLIASCIGYETIKIPVTAGITEYKIEMPEKPTLLQPVEISNKQTWTTAVLKDYKLRKRNHHRLFIQSYIIQLAKHFTVPAEYSVLQSVRLHITAKESIFRLRVYDIDSASGHPADDLCSNPIEIKSGETDDDINIDLTKYNIVIPGKEFFVAIEWIKIPQNFIEPEKEDGSGFFYYRPIVSLLDSKSDTKNQFLNYANYWEPFMLYDIAISATIKY